MPAIAEAHGEDARLDPQAGPGACFEIVLPATATSFRKEMLIGTTT